MEKGPSLLVPFHCTILTAPLFSIGCVQQLEDLPRRRKYLLLICMPQYIPSQGQTILPISLSQLVTSSKKAGLCVHPHDQLEVWIGLGMIEHGRHQAESM